jgi:hypothetical protein
MPRLTYNQLKYKYSNLKQKVNKLQAITKLLESEDEAKYKIAIDIMIKYMKTRVKDEDVDITLRDIPASDIQIWCCRKIK